MVEWMVRGWWSGVSEWWVEWLSGWWVGWLRGWLSGVVERMVE